MYIIHHSKDLDGLSSGAICKLKYPEAKIIGWDYSDPIPDFKQFKDEEVIMIDITFPIEKMQELNNLTKQLTLIDHHISFKKDYDELVYTDNTPSFIYIYELGIAACEIGWKYLFPDELIPYGITLLGRYDTWRKDEGNWEEETLPFQYYMRTECISVESFPIYSITMDKFEYTEKKITYNGIKIGKSILKYQQQQDLLNTQRYAFETIVGGYKALCLNITAFSSNTVISKFDPQKHDIMVGFSYTGKKWIISLRSIGDIDVSILAKSKGGGGHKNAAGFECNSFKEIFI